MTFLPQIDVAARSAGLIGLPLFGLRQAIGRLVVITTTATCRTRSSDAASSASAAGASRSVSSLLALVSPREAANQETLQFQPAATKAEAMGITSASVDMYSGVGLSGAQTLSLDDAQRFWRPWGRACTVTQPAAPPLRAHFFTWGGGNSSGTHWCDGLRAQASIICSSNSLSSVSSSDSSCCLVCPFHFQNRPMPLSGRSGSGHAGLHTTHESLARLGNLTELGFMAHNSL